MKRNEEKTRDPLPPSVAAARLAVAIAGGDMRRALAFVEAKAEGAELAESRAHWSSAAAEVRRLLAEEPA